MSDLFLYLYPLLSFSCVMSYLPQIKAFVFAQQRPTTFAAAMWTIWVGECLVSLGYGIFQLKDTLFIILCSIEISMITIVLMLGLYNQHIRFEKNNKAVEAAA